MKGGSIATMFGAAAAAVLVGCRSDHGGDARLSALGARPLVLEQSVREGVYADLDSEHGFWFSSLSLQELAAAKGSATRIDGVIVHAQMVWKPEPGRTPMTATATNTVMRVLVMSDGELGIYGGAGFAWPLDPLNADEVEVEFRGGTLTLLESTKGFHDLMSPAELTGRLKARRAPEEVGDWRRGASQFATNALGKSIWVDARPDADADRLLTRR